MNTVHLSDNDSKWYSRRKPKLQVDILGCLVLNGNLTKGMAEKLLQHRRHADILESFDKLEEKELIKKTSIRFGSGRKQFFYKITDAGVEVLINEDTTDPLRFWKILVGFCHHNDKPVNLEKIDHLTTIFIEKYIKYKNSGSLYQSDIFDNSREIWLNEYTLDAKHINIDQKILEILSINRGITIQEIAKISKSSVSEISQVLSKYTLEKYTPPDNEGTYYIHQNIIGKRHNKRYWDFLLHCLVYPIDDDSNATGEKRFELSLYGIILVLTIIRENDRKRLKSGLFYKDDSFVDYVNKIVDNYKDKLPLIFGKWNILNETLRLCSHYNFDVILFKDLRTDDSNKISVTRGGNKELIEGIKEIIFDRQTRLGDFLNTGRIIMMKYANIEYNYNNTRKSDDYLIKNDISREQPDDKKVYVIENFLQKLYGLLYPIEYVSNEPLIPKDHLGKILKIYEKMYEFEISYLYYFQLSFEYEFNTRFCLPMSYYSQVENPKTGSSPIYSIPKECLSYLVEHDTHQPLLSEWLSDLTMDIHLLYTDIENYFAPYPFKKIE